MVHSMIWTICIFFSVQVCVKNGHDENAIIEGEEIVLETVDTSSHMLPVIVDEAGTSVVEEIIQVRTMKLV